MALPALPFSTSLSPQELATVKKQFEDHIRYAMRNFLREVMHNANQYLDVNSGDLTFRNTLFTSYLPAMQTEEVTRNLLNSEANHGGDWDRSNIESNDLAGTLTPIDHVRLLGKTTGVTG